MQPLSRYITSSSKTVNCNGKVAFHFTINHHILKLKAPSPFIPLKYPTCHHFIILNHSIQEVPLPNSLLRFLQTRSKKSPNLCRLGLIFTNGDSGVRVVYSSSPISVNLSPLLMVRFPAINPIPPINLLQQNHSHHLMRKSHL